MGNGFALEVPVNVPDNMPWVARVKLYLHLAQFIMIFLTMCVTIPVITTENKFYNGSQSGPNYTLVISILSVGIPATLVYFPWAYDYQNRFKAIGKFALNPRTNIVFASFYSVMWAISGIAMTAHANNPSHCTLDNNLSDKYGDNYIQAWVNQCNLGKACAAFAWLTCLMWLGALVCAIIIFWNEKQVIQQNIKDSKRNRIEALADEHGGIDTLSYEVRALSTPPFSHLVPQKNHDLFVFQNPSYYYPGRP